MEEETFWGLIQRLDWARAGDDTAVVEPVVVALTAMPVEEIHAFQEMLARKLYALDGRSWYEQAGPEPDSLSGDDFLYARCVVVANGRSFYEGVLANPSRMPKEMEFESLLYVARKAEERKVGRTDGIDTQVSYESFSNPAGWHPSPDGFT
jgi:hypothetical protein